MLQEGTDSKKLSEAEEQHLLKFAREVSVEFRGGFLTSRELRQLAHMGETSSERTLCSDLLGSWVKKGYVEKVRNGVYKFPLPEAPSREAQLNFQAIIEALKKNNWYCVLAV